MGNWYKQSQVRENEFTEDIEDAMPPQMARYRTSIIIEVRVPENQDKKMEVQAAKAKADEILQEVNGVIGDEAIGLDSEAIRLGPGLISTPVNW